MGIMLKFLLELFRLDEAQLSQLGVHIKVHCANVKENIGTKCIGMMVEMYSLVSIKVLGEYWCRYAVMTSLFSTFQKLHKSFGRNYLR